MNEPDTTVSLTALELAIQYIEWERPVSYREYQENIAGFSRYETARRPNKAAQRKANEVRELAGLALVDYSNEYPDL